MKKIFLNGMAYDGVEYIQIPTEDGGVATFHDNVEGIPTISTLDEALLVANNKGKIYKCDGELYTIVETYVPSTNGTAFWLADGKMIAPTDSGNYHIAGAVSFNGGVTKNITIRVRTDTNDNPPSYDDHYTDWVNDYAYIYEAYKGDGFVKFPTAVMVECVEGFFVYDIHVADGDILSWAKENGKPLYKRGLAFARVDRPYEVNVLSVDFLISENEGKVYKWLDELYQIRKGDIGDYTNILHFHRLTAV